MNISSIIAVASGGAIGAILRLLINTSINKHFSLYFPLATLVVNLLGALLIGIFFAYFQYNTTVSPAMRTFLITGVLGALTTYSTFAIESFLMLESGHYLQAFANMALNLFGTILFAGLGYVSILYFTK